MIINTQFHTKYRPRVFFLCFILMKDIGRWLPWMLPGATGRFYKRLKNVSSEYDRVEYKMDPRLEQSDLVSNIFELAWDNVTKPQSTIAFREPLPNGQEQEEAETNSDHPTRSHPTCWVASASWFYFQDCCRAQRSARRYVPGRDPLASGQEA